jgi:hypothetical protein
MCTRFREHRAGCTAQGLSASPSHPLSLAHGSLASRLEEQEAWSGAKIESAPSTDAYWRMLGLVQVDAGRWYDPERSLVKHSRHAEDGSGHEGDTSWAGECERACSPARQLATHGTPQIRVLVSFPMTSVQPLTPCTPCPHASRSDAQAQFEGIVDGYQARAVAEGSNPAAGSAAGARVLGRLGQRAAGLSGRRAKAGGERSGSGADEVGWLERRDLVFLNSNGRRTRCHPTSVRLCPASVLSNDVCLARACRVCQAMCTTLWMRWRRATATRTRRSAGPVGERPTWLHLQNSWHMSKSQRTRWRATHMALIDPYGPD